MELTIDIFKKLATPFCHNKNKKPKKYSNRYYVNFKKYLELHDLEKTITEESFEKYFLDFCRIHFKDENEIRLEFSDKIKLDLLKRSGGCCAICGTLTIFPMENNKNEALSIGAACHIMPASEYGPRANVEYRNKNLEKIGLIENGIWACLNCHKEIDDNDKTYTVNKLQEIKENHELKILKLKESKIDIKKLMDNFEKFSNTDYIYIKREIYEQSQQEFLNMYITLKNIEKESIENISIYQLNKYLKLFTKNNKTKYDKIRIEMTNDSYQLIAQGVKDHRNMKEQLTDLMTNKDISKFSVNTEKKIPNIELFYDDEKDLELFLLNKDETSIVKIKKHGFNIVHTNGLEFTIKNEDSLVLEVCEIFDLNMEEFDLNMGDSENNDIDFIASPITLYIKINDNYKFNRFLIESNMDNCINRSGYLLIKYKDILGKIYIKDFNDLE